MKRRDFLKTVGGGTLSLAPSRNLRGMEEILSGDRFLYWEYPQRRLQQAVRWRDWKAVRLAPDRDLELYNLSADISEARNVAAENPEIIARMESYLKGARTESPNWPTQR